MQYKEFKTQKEKLIENNYNEDGSINIPEVLRPYMGNKEMIGVKK